jgi:SAM-dependent methyltransferase
LHPAEYERMYRLEETLWWYVALHARTLAAARRQIGSVRAARILDAGCGTGGMARHLAALGEVTAIDYSGVALGFAARRELPRLGRASVERLPFRSDTFDLVVSLDVLCHGAVGSEAGAMAEMARVLRPGGHLILNLPAYPALMSAHDHLVYNTRRFLPSQVRQFLGDAGLRAVEFTCWNTLLFPAAALVRLRHRRRTTGVSDVAAPAPGVNRLLARIQSLEQALNRWVSFPFGLSIFAVGGKEGDASSISGRKRMDHAQ